MFLSDILPMPLFLLMILQIISIDTCILALADHSKKAYTCTKFRVMHPQILLFGGTSQGRLLSQELSAQNITHYYSTKTAVSYRPAGRSVSLTGAMSAADCTVLQRPRSEINCRCISSFCREPPSRAERRFCLVQCSFTAP